ncbi:MAG: hypothetical protein HUU30_15205, partial [Burkholderiaceae bacterium]|nr:hypothetical protein [Burkholderiaceae bacterium]
MTYTSVSEALTALSGVAASEADIIAFVRQLPVSASGTTTLLYSGVIDGTPAWKIVEDMSDDIRRIDKTVAYTVLNSEEFITKVAQAYGLTYEAFQAELDNRGSTHPAKLWMNKGGSGPWAVASEMFVEATTGAVKIVTTAPLADSVLLRNEIPKLLDNPNVPTIDGVPRTEWAALRDSKGLDAVKQAIVANSFDQVVLSKLGIGNTENYLHWTDDAAQVAREDKALAKAYLETLEQLTVEQRSYLKAGATSLEDMAHSPTAGPGLIKKLGLIALPLSLTLAALDAKAAVAEGDNPRAFEIMKEWAIDAAGSSVAQAALGAVAALGTAALVAGGAIPAGFAAAVVVGAGLFGGFYGGDAAVDLYRWLLRDDSALGEVAEAVTTHFRAAFTLPKCDPLAIDLDSDGIETVGIGGAPVLFDHDGDGLRSGTGWLKPDD